MTRTVSSGSSVILVLALLTLGIVGCSQPPTSGSDKGASLAAIPADPEEAAFLARLAKAKDQAATMTQAAKDAEAAKTKACPATGDAEKQQIESVMQETKALQSIDKYLISGLDVPTDIRSEEIRMRIRRRELDALKAAVVLVGQRIPDVFAGRVETYGEVVDYLGAVDRVKRDELNAALERRYPILTAAHAAAKACADASGATARAMSRAQEASLEVSSLLTREIERRKATGKP